MVPATQCPTSRRCRLRFGNEEVEGTVTARVLVVLTTYVFPRHLQLIQEQRDARQSGTPLPTAGPTPAQQPATPAYSAAPAASSPSTPVQIGIAGSSETLGQFHFSAAIAPIASEEAMHSPPLAPSPLPLLPSPSVALPVPVAATVAAVPVAATVAAVPVAAVAAAVPVASSATAVPIAVPAVALPVAATAAAMPVAATVAVVPDSVAVAAVPVVAAPTAVPAAAGGISASWALAPGAGAVAPAAPVALQAGFAGEAAALQATGEGGSWGGSRRHWRRLLRGRRQGGRRSERPVRPLRGQPPRGERRGDVLH